MQMSLGEPGIIPTNSTFFWADHAEKDDMINIVYEIVKTLIGFETVLRFIIALYPEKRNGSLFRRGEAFSN